MPYTIVGPHARPDTTAKPPTGPAPTGQDPSTWVQQHDTTTPFDLSVSVQLEFFAAMKRIQFNKMTHETLRHLIGREMERAKMQAPSGKVAQIHVPSEQQLDAARGDEIVFPPGHWIVNRDTSIDPDRPEWFDDFELQPIKLMSPPYLGLQHWGELETDIGSLLGTIDDPYEEADLYCELNPSTHFHVEVGNIAGDGRFELPTVQRLAILVLAFEKLIDKMLADHMGYITESLWAGSQQLNPAFRDLSMSASCHRILRECTTIEKLTNMMCPDLPRSENPEFRHYYKYNFMPLLSERAVIEFRQHEGTLNAVEIVRWVRFVGALVSLAHNIDIQNLARLAHLNDTKPVNFTELCAAMSAFGALPVLEIEDVLWYTRKIHGRGGPMHTGMSLKYIPELPHIKWKEVRERKAPEDEAE